MLTLTENATTAVKAIVERNPDVQEAGLRISSDRPNATEFAVAITPEPEQGDTIVEQSGARVFLGGDAATTLESKILDAQLSEDGSVRFALAEQA